MPNVNDNPPFDPVGNDLGPNNRVEAYLGVIAGLENHELPSAPSSRVEAYLEYIANHQQGADPRVDEILELIPDEASAENQLGDKEFINSSIATQTAHYIYKTNESGDKLPFDSLEELEAYTGTVTPNDYAFVTGIDTDGNRYFDRYKYTENEDTGELVWAKEYRLNNSSFTAAQWAAINSGITAAIVNSIAEKKLYVVNYTSPNYTIALDRFNSGYVVVCKMNSKWYIALDASTANRLDFYPICMEECTKIEITSSRGLKITREAGKGLKNTNTWSNLSAKTFTLDEANNFLTNVVNSSSTHTKVPTAKAVYDAISGLPIPADKLYIIDYSSPNYTEAAAAFNAGKIVVVNITRGPEFTIGWYIVQSADSFGLYFRAIEFNYVQYKNITMDVNRNLGIYIKVPILMTDSTWNNSQTTITIYASGLVEDTIPSSATNTKLPTSKAVKDAIDTALESIDEEDWVFKLDATTTVTKHVKVRET